MSTLNRKLTTKEKQLQDNNKNFENLINEYKTKITNLMNFNDTSVEKIKDLENDNRVITDLNKKLESTCLELERNINLLKDKFDEEQRSKIKHQHLLEDTDNKVKILIDLIQNLFDNERTRISNEVNYFNKVRSFMEGWQERNIRNSRDKEIVNRVEQSFPSYDYY